MKNIKYTLLLSSLIILSCKKEPDTPPIDTIVASQIVTIDSLRNWETQSGPLSITEELSVYGVVTMDESSGNIYKQLYVQDHTAGINVRLTSSCDFRAGDSVRIALKGAYLSDYAGVIQLDSIDPDKAIIKQSSDNTFDAAVKTIDQITLEDEGLLVKLENVQFQYAELGQTFADAANQSSENRMIEDCSGNTIIVRTSGYASYAGTSLPTGNGSITCIVNQYNGEIQLILRSYNEITLSGARCPGQLIMKDFDDNSITSGGWIVQQVTGTLTWATSDLGGAPEPYGMCSNWNGSANEQTESWLISPALDLSNSTSADLSFENACNYTGDALALLISTDYPGTGDPNGYTWTPLTATWSTGSWAWVNSGVIDLSAYLTSGVRIAFKYTGNTSSGKTWELDDIVVNG
ncbi:MAG: choice-of-anchor J domain-containing protein [Crocinitomicaceae bacterium]|nr:choice-of-anchor J domain-containing protein [Crocinitomicaceae bacterium]MBK8925453.1 choice-of-anchor J domain-containing protein [Crocinitomicaceae bacterium]